MEIESILVLKALPDGDFDQNVVIDFHRRSSSGNHLRHPTPEPSVLQEDSSDDCVYTRGSVRRASGFVPTGKSEVMPEDSQRRWPEVSFGEVGAYRRLEWMASEWETISIGL